MSPVQKRRLAWAIGVACAIVVGGAIVAPFFRSTQGVAPAGPAGLAGQPAAVIAMRDEAGKPVSLAQYRGRVVVMNLWASWCPPCRVEMPELQRFADAYAGRGVVTIGVNQGESAARAQAFARALDIHFPIWLDERQQYGRAYTALGLPTTVVVGRDGTVVTGFDGPLTYEQIRAAVARALAPGPAR
ncbi:MAG TPA: TlpA disulfide reductase family protein [Candidatus Tumulicola sp.]